MTSYIFSSRETSVQSTATSLKHVCSLLLCVQRNDRSKRGGELVSKKQVEKGSDNSEVESVNQGVKFAFARAERRVRLLSAPIYLFRSLDEPQTRAACGYAPKCLFLKCDRTNRAGGASIPPRQTVAASLAIRAGACQHHQSITPWGGAPSLPLRKP